MRGRLACRALAIAVLFAATTAIASAQSGRAPMLTNGVANAAGPDYQDESRRVAPGSIFLIRGFYLGPEELVTAEVPLPRRLPDMPGGTVIEFQSAQTGEIVQPQLLHSWIWQVAGIVPADLDPGEYNVSVSFDGRATDPEAFTVAAEAPGIFSLSMEGDGPGVIQTADSPFGAARNQLTNPALPGDSLVVWTTGLGSGGGAPGDVVVEVGTALIAADAAEPAPGFPGVELVRFRLPATEPAVTGCYVPLRVGTKTAVSNTVTVSVSDVRGRCEHPLGFNVEQMARLDAGGTLQFAALSINRWHAPLLTTGLIDFGGKVGHASARFYRADAVETARQSSSLPPAPPGCRISQVNQLAFFLLGFPALLKPTAARIVDAADRRRQSVESPLWLLGPQGQSVELEANDVYQESENIRYYETLTSTPWEFFSGGRWRFEQEIAGEIGPYRAEIDLAPPIPFEPPAVLSKFQPAVFSWPTAGLTDSQFISVRMDYFAPGLGQFDRFIPLALSIECRAPATSGTITFPVDELRWYPDAMRGSATFTFEVSEPAPRRFSAPGLDYGTVRASHTVVRQVEVR